MIEDRNELFGRVYLNKRKTKNVCVCAGINSGLAHSKCHVAIYMYAVLCACVITERKGKINIHGMCQIIKMKCF